MRRRFPFPLTTFGLLFMLMMRGPALFACTASQAFVASGESIAAMGETFVAVGESMDRALDSKVVTVEQYRTWATFAKRFKLVYDPACGLWKSAEAAKDAPAAQAATSVLAQLAVELSQFAALAAGGAP